MLTGLEAARDGLGQIGLLWRSAETGALRSLAVGGDRWCRPTCEETTLESTRGTPRRGGRGPSSTAAPVSSQVVSIPRTSIGVRSRLLPARGV